MAEENYKIINPGSKLNSICKVYHKKGNEKRNEIRQRNYGK
jgi:hypothetical protein